jgi:hypothetical protein
MPCCTRSFIALFAVSLLSFTGCAKSPAEAPDAASSEATSAHEHSGWWCDEHGVPEGECGQCNSKLAAAFQKRGDWCNEHDRPDSQCFVCHPELEAVFADKYEARMGKRPPKPNG